MLLDWLVPGVHSWPTAFNCDIEGSTLKNPWLYFSGRSEGAEHQLAFTDLGNASKWVHTDGLCPMPSPTTSHPALIFKRPVAYVHAKLEDITDKENHKTLWDAEYSVPNRIRIMPKDRALSGNLPQMLPICTKTVQEMTHKHFRLTLNERPPAQGDNRFKEFEGVYDIKVRPLGDKFVSTQELNRWAAQKAHNGEFDILRSSLNSLLCVKASVTRKYELWVFVTF